ncbi:MAG: hypothetical protein ACTSUE_05035 [Promethearchaeota archaeon]
MEEEKKQEFYDEFLKLYHVYSEDDDPVVVEAWEEVRTFLRGQWLDWNWRDINANMIYLDEITPVEQDKLFEVSPVEKLAMKYHSLFPGPSHE